MACRTSTAILRVQCGVPDLNRDPASSVWRAGVQPRSREFSVACRTSTAIEKISSRCSDLKEVVARCLDKSERMSERMSEDMSERMSKDMSERMSKDNRKNVRR